MALSDEDVREILRIIDESELDELRLDSEGFSLYVRRGPGTGNPPSTAASSSPSASAPQPAGAETASAKQAEPEAASPAEHQDGKLTIESPMLGTFYRAEGPGQSPFVEVGSEVEPDTTVCIIEVMKMMNSVPAGVAGTVVEVCHENAELVEYGTPLFRVEPAG